MMFHRHRLIFFALFLCASLVMLMPTVAQRKTARASSAKLPSPERIIAEYIKTTGGQKRIAAIRDAVYEWDGMLDGATPLKLKTQLKTPAFVRTDITFAQGTICTGVNASSVWLRQMDGVLQTLTDIDANTIKLRATLEASRLLELKKSEVLTRTVGLESLNDEPCYTVEFTTREGARWRYWFNVASKLPVQAESETGRKTIVRFSDYQNRGGIFEPHRLETSSGGDNSGTTKTVLTLKDVRYNTNPDDAIFDPPHSAETIDVAALIREVGKNQGVVDERVRSYTYTERENLKVVDNHGSIKEAKVKTYEVFPLPGRRPIKKLTSEDGIPLSPERAAKETKRAGEELEKAGRERAKDTQKSERRKRENQAKRAKATGDRNDETQSDDEDEKDSRFFLTPLLRASEFVAPRRERFHERDAIVFDFRPRVGYKPQNRDEEFLNGSVGTVWIDPQDKQVMRMEARLTKPFKLAAGLLVTIKPGAAFTIEQTRLPDGLWMPGQAQFNAGFKFLMLVSANVNFALEWSDYRRFDTETKDVKLDAPKQKSQQ